MTPKRLKTNLSNLTNLHKSEAFKKSRFSRANLTIFAIVFAAIGGYLIYSSFAATSCTGTNVDTSTFASAVNSAAPGTTLCLATGNYGSFGGVNKTSPGVTIAAQSGATPKMIIDFGNANNAAWLTFDGIKIGGGRSVICAPAHDITFKNAEASAELDIEAGANNNDCSNAPAMQNSNIVFDNIQWTYADDPTGDASWKIHEGRLTVLGGAATGSIGVTVKNSLFTGGCADGIQADAAGGMVVQDTEFANITLGLPNCGVHADSVQFYCGTNSTGGGACGRMTFNRDYFHDDQVGIVDYDSRTNGMVVSNSVFVNVPANNGSGNPCDAICLTGGIGLSVSHTTMKSAYINLGGNHSGTPATNTSVRDSILAAPPGTDAGSTFTALDHNICMSGTCTGTGSLNGTPTWTGGASPIAYAGFALASGSLGKNAASDGTDMGINVPSSQWAGTFDCYGTTGCSNLPTLATCTSTISSGLQTALNNATGGAVICLNSGSYGNIALTSKAYSSDVIVQPASGATVTVGSVTLNAVTHLRFTGVGGASATMSVGGSEIDVSSGCSTNITFNYVTYTSGAFTYPTYSCSHGMAILYDHDRFDNISGPGGGEEQRFRVIDTLGHTQTDGITLSNSHISGGCSDGIDFAGSPYGTVIGPGNEFTNINQAYSDANCAGTHVDPIQGLGSDHTLVTGNWFHDNGSGSGGILSAGEPGLTVTNNVFASTGYGCSILVKAGSNETISHNWFAEDICYPNSDSGGSGSNNIIRNNVFSGGGITNEGGGTAWIADHNLGLDVTGTPVYVGTLGSSYYNYQLASNSPGYKTGTDGLSLGIADPSGATGGGGSSDPTPPTVSMTAPSAGASVSGTSVTLSATASDNVGVSSVQFKLDGSNIGSADTTSPYSTTWDSTTVPNGTHTITATARDAAGNTTTSSSVSVAVSNTGNINIGETTITPSDDSANANLLVAQAATLSQSASIQSLSFYVTIAAGKLRLGIYDATGPSGGPGAKKAETAEITPTTGWNSATTTTHPTLSAGTYWLTYLPSDNTLAFKKSDTSTQSSRFYSFTYGTLPNTFSTAPSTTPSHWSLYATLTIAQSGPKTGDINQDNNVNITDLSLLLSSYNQNVTKCVTNNAYTCDLSSPSDGVVNIFDLSILLSHYGA